MTERVHRGGAVRDVFQRYERTGGPGEEERERRRRVPGEKVEASWGWRETTVKRRTAKMKDAWCLLGKRSSLSDCFACGEETKVFFSVAKGLQKESAEFTSLRKRKEKRGNVKNGN